MYQGKKILALIPARGVSRGIPHKNIALLRNKPLLYYSIKIAQQIDYIDRIIVSSDDPKILAIAKKYGTEVIKRPKRFAQDNSKMDSVIRHVLKILERKDSYILDLIVLLQPTSPLRKLLTVKKAVNEFIQKIDNYDSLMPLWQIEGKLGKIVGHRYKPFNKVNMQRQQLKPFYKECGTIFIFKPAIIKSGSLYGKNIYPFVILNQEEALDIDSKEDIKLADYFLKLKK